MIFTDALLRKLDEQRQALAEAAFAKPQGRDAFEYGRMCGLYAGLSLARDLLVNLLDEADAAQRDL